jgi:hypothetical protein
VLPDTHHALEQQVDPLMIDEQAEQPPTAGAYRRQLPLTQISSLLQALKQLPQ